MVPMVEPSLSHRQTCKTPSVVCVKAVGLERAVVNCGSVHGIAVSHSRELWLPVTATELDCCNDGLPRPRDVTSCHGM
jgi:hypothetical protein